MIPRHRLLPINEPKPGCREKKKGTTGKGEREMGRRAVARTSKGKKKKSNSLEQLEVETANSVALSPQMFFVG